MAADTLAPQGARVSAARVLAYFPRNQVKSSQVKSSQVKALAAEGANSKGFDFQCARMATS